MGGFAALLADELRRRGWNPTQFAQRARINQSHLSKILRGVRPPPNRQINHIADVLGLDEPARDKLLLLAALDRTPLEAQLIMADLAQAVESVVNPSSHNGLTTLGKPSFDPVVVLATLSLIHI
jgi:transcriptional regulator with XRE-family HTH domain